VHPSYQVGRVEYKKKKDKKASIKFVKDERIIKDDVYKSSTVSVASGEAASSISRPPARRKEREAKPIGQGKLLRTGGPSGPSKAPVAAVRTNIHIHDIDKRAFCL